MADSKAEGAGRTTPPWMVSAVESALAAPTELVRALRLARDAALSKRARNNPCAEPVHALLEILPVKLAVATVEGIWDHADGSLRAVLAEQSAVVVDRMHEHRAGDTVSLETMAQALAEMTPGMPGPSLREVRKLMQTSLGRRIAEDLAEESGAKAVLPASMEREFWALARRSAPYDVTVLERALTLGTERAEAQRLLREHLTHRPTFHARLSALRDAVLAECSAVASAIEEHFCDDITPTAMDAARVLTALDKSGVPRRLRDALARELLLAVEREPEQAATPEVARALKVARRRIKPRNAKQDKPPKLKKEKPPAKRRKTKIARTPDQAGTVASTEAAQLELVAAGEEERRARG